MNNDALHSEQSDLRKLLGAGASHLNVLLEKPATGLPGDEQPGGSGE